MNIILQKWKPSKISYQINKLIYAQSTDQKLNEMLRLKDSNFENKILQIKNTMVIF